jgi:SAM-dependent methyltransferase
VSGRSSAENPGAYRARVVAGPRAIAAAALQALRRGEVRNASVRIVTDAINLFEARAHDVLRPRFRCSCCGYAAHAFGHLVARATIAWNSACPRCDSRSRHRGLAVLLPRIIAELAPRRVLHIAPEPILKPFFTGSELVYETADLHLQDVDHTGVDLQHLPFADGAYDLVVCNHVLEHVPDDRLAMAELGRVISDRGRVLITVPGDFSRQPTTTFTGRLENGHFRHYGLDLVDALHVYFGRVDVRDLHDLDRDDSGLSRAIRPLDLAFVCARR